MFANLALYCVFVLSKDKTQHIKIKQGFKIDL